MLTGYLGQIKIVEVELSQLLNKLQHTQINNKQMNQNLPFLSSLKCFKQLPSQDKIKISFNVPNFNKICVDNEQLQISYKRLLPQSSIKIDELINILKKSQLNISEYRPDLIKKALSTPQCHNQQNNMGKMNDEPPISIKQVQSTFLQPKVVKSEMLESSLLIKQVNSTIIENNIENTDIEREKVIDEIFEKVQKLDKSIDKDRVQFYVESIEIQDPDLLVEIIHNEE